MIKLPKGGVYMEARRVVIISGPPGAGKSSVSRRLAEASVYGRAVHMHTDDFYNVICERWK